ncbi:hypothetical protein BV22DRAFT_1052400 [Leucogyrophana mollusca]|uniref:Uncharacterized protein n=1 Tax=Leucogyrophana mollusca TaxID=85980 RepID=A0ACB8AX84_9AGAM|nr:hypothetical protein BV22DRAFT_1052400 [Leucogyrophana mollusca]
MIPFDDATYPTYSGLLDDLLDPGFAGEPYHQPSEPNIDPAGAASINADEISFNSDVHCLPSTIDPSLLHDGDSIHVSRGNPESLGALDRYISTLEKGSAITTTNLGNTARDHVGGPQIPSQAGRAPPDFVTNRMGRRMGSLENVFSPRGSPALTQHNLQSISSGSRLPSVASHPSGLDSFDQQSVAESAGTTSAVDLVVIGAAPEPPLFYQRAVTTTQALTLHHGTISAGAAKRILDRTYLNLTMQACSGAPLLPEHAEAKTRALRSIRAEYAREFPNDGPVSELTELIPIPQATVDKITDHAKAGVITWIIGRITHFIEPNVVKQQKNDFSTIPNISGLKFGLFDAPEDSTPLTAKVVAQRCLGKIKNKEMFLMFGNDIMGGEDFETLVKAAFYGEDCSMYKLFPDVFGASCPQHAMLALAVAIFSIFYRRRLGKFEKIVTRGPAPKPWLAFARACEEEVSGLLNAKLLDPTVRSSFDAMRERITAAISQDLGMYEQSERSRFSNNCMGNSSALIVIWAKAIVQYKLLRAPHSYLVFTQRYVGPDPTSAAASVANYDRAPFLDLG